MGQVPNRHPIYMSEIASALGGTHDLGWYRGRQYWNAGGAVVYISQNPSMAEFPGITNVSPVTYNGTLYSRGSPDYPGSIYGFAVPVAGAQAYGDLQPRSCSMGTFYRVDSSNFGAPEYIWTILGFYGHIGNGGFSALHVPNVVWLNRTDAYFSNGSVDGVGAVTEWDWGVDWARVADYNLRLEA